MMMGFTLVACASDARDAFARCTELHCTPTPTCDASGRPEELCASYAKRKFQRCVRWDCADTGG